MFSHQIQFIAISALFLVSPFVWAGQYVLELEKPLTDFAEGTEVAVDHSFDAGEDSYAVLSANDQTSLEQFLTRNNVTVEKISKVLFVNSPIVGGGSAAGDVPRDGHQVFVIERPIPGVGFFGLEKKTKISKGSNNAVAKLGEIIEWDHSYLTSDGTYCVYRADSPETLREHAALAGAPIGKITPVDHTTSR